MFINELFDETMPPIGEAKRPFKQGTVLDYPVPKKLNKGVDKIYQAVLQQQVDRENGETVKPVRAEVAVVVDAHPGKLSYGTLKRIGRSGLFHVKLNGGKIKDWAAGDEIAVQPHEVYATWDPKLQSMTTVHREYNDDGSRNVREGEVTEAYALKKRVKIVGKPAPYAWIGKYGWIGEIRHGLHNKSPKMYTVDLDHGGGSIMLPKEALRLVKDPVVDESEFSIHGSGSNFDAAGFERHMAKLRAQAELKKTDPMRALVNDLHAEDEYKASMRKREAAARAPSDSKSDPNWDPYNADSANSIYNVLSQHKD
jgi:hypothetical protein